MEGDHAKVKTVAKGHFSSALVSVHLRIQVLEDLLDNNPVASRLQNYRQLQANIWVLFYVICYSIKDSKTQRLYDIKQTIQVIRHKCKTRPCCHRSCISGLCGQVQKSQPSYQHLCAGQGDC